MKNMEMKLAENIRAFRKERGLTQEQLAEVLGVTTGAVHKWEARLSVPDVELIVKMADFFDTSVDVLLGYELKDNRLKATVQRLREYRRNKDPEGLAEAEKALKKYPHSFKIVRECASLYSGFGLESGNRAYLLRSLELTEQSLPLLGQNTAPEINEQTIYGKMANIYLGLDETDKAIELLKAHNAGGFYNHKIGQILAMRERGDEAAPFLSEAMAQIVGKLIYTVTGYVQLLNYLLRPIQLFPNFFAGRQSALRLMEKLAVALSQNIPDEGEHIAPKLTEGISIRGLDFAYEENKPVLSGIDMDIAAGGCYALVGGSGSGKSTILNLLMASSREYGGEIPYDGKELKTLSPSSLYDLVSIIQQNVFVFNSTIRNNITMFSDFPAEEVDRAVRMSGLQKLIEEKGEDYLCGENGSGLSGGERQRISIARALLRNTPVLLIDEATASLDNETSFEVLDAILKLDGYTRIIITHDLDENILRRCTGIFTLKKGELSEQGAFKDLMEKKGYFYSLFTVSQK